MHFNLNIKAASNEIKFGEHSCLVKFFIESKLNEKLLESFQQSLNVSLNKIQKINFIDRKGDELIYYTEKAEPSVIFLKKVKLDEDFTTDFFRNYFAGFIPSLIRKNIKTVNVILPNYNDFKSAIESEEYFLQTFIEGIMLGNYTFDNYKSEKEKTDKLNIVFHYTNKNLLNRIIVYTQKIIESVYFTRDLVNEPAITLTPMELGKRAKLELNRYGVNVKVFDKKELERKKNECNTCCW